MTHAALSPLIGPEFDPFLGAAIGEDRNGTDSASCPRLPGSTWIPGGRRGARADAEGSCGRAIDRAD